MEQDATKIRMTRAGYEERQKELKEQKNKLSKIYKDCYDDEFKFGIDEVMNNCVFDSIRDEQNRLKERINTIKKELENAIIIEDIISEIKVGSVVTLLLKYEVDDDEVITGEVVETKGLKDNISINSAVGRQILDKTIGDVFTANTEAGLVKVKILDVVNR